MKYGQISGNKRISTTIYRCFSYLPEREILKFVRKFRTQPHDQPQVMHTFRELILGAYLFKNGFLAESEHKIETKTPDWCITDKNLMPICIIELVNFHLDKETSDEVEEGFRERGAWANFTKPNTARLYTSIQKKCATYKMVATKQNLPYIVSVFGDFMADVQNEEIEECLFDSEWGLFYMYPELSGLLYFSEVASDYAFIYRPNTWSANTFSVPSGVFEKYEPNADL